MVDLKYQSMQIGKMKDYQLTKTINEALLKIHVITGWNIPANELMLLLVEQFRLKVIESYSDLNIDEIEYAFRNNVGIKEWGKNMSINLLDEVLNPYLVKRRELSEMEEKISNQKLLPPEEKELSKEEMWEWVNDWINKVPTILDAGIVPLDFYDFLVKENEIALSNEVKKDYWKKAIEKKRKENFELLSKNKQSGITQTTNDDFERSVSENNFKEGEIRMLRMSAKKLVVFDYLKNKSNEVS